MTAETRLAPPDRILEAAGRLLQEGGREAVTTRAVSTAADVQAQTIYRHYGDMKGLLDAVVTRAFEAFLNAKQSQETQGDPVERLRRGWDMHVQFGLDNQSLYMLMYSDRTGGDAPRPGVAQVYGLLRTNVSLVAKTGRLVVPVDTAASMIYAAGVGVTLNLISTNQGGATVDSAVSTRTRDAILAAVTTMPSSPSQARTAAEQVRTHAVSLAALAPAFNSSFSTGEATLLGEWLDKLSHHGEATQA